MTSVEDDKFIKLFESFIENKLKENKEHCKDKKEQILKAMFSGKVFAYAEMLSFINNLKLKSHE